MGEELSGRWRSSRGAPAGSAVRPPSCSWRKAPRSSSPTWTSSAVKSWRRPSATRPRSSAPTSPTPTRCRRSSTSPSGSSAGSHVMFNNAGIPSSFDRILDNDLADFERVMAVNLFGVDRRHPARGAPHGGARRRLHHQHGVDRRTQRRRGADRVPRVEGGGRPVQPVGRDRPGGVRDPGELHRARPHRHRDHELRHGAGDPADAAAAAPRHAGRRGERRPVPRPATGRRRSPGSCSRSTAGPSPARRSRQLRDLMQGSRGGRDAG